MSVRKLTASLLIVLAMLGGVASGQVLHNSPPADPFAFDPDFRWFEPVYDADLADLTPKQRAPKGWFSTYDRLMLYASRPELSAAAGNRSLDAAADSGYGHRYEIGYMQPGEDTGWLFNWTEFGVGAFDTIRVERLNRFLQPAPGTPASL